MKKSVPPFNAFNDEYNSIMRQLLLKMSENQRMVLKEISSVKCVNAEMKRNKIEHWAELRG